MACLQFTPCMGFKPEWRKPFCAHYPFVLPASPSYAKFSLAPCKKDRGQCNNVPLLCPECIDGQKQVVCVEVWHGSTLSTRIRVWRMGSHLRWVPRK